MTGVVLVLVAAGLAALVGRLVVPLVRERSWVWGILASVAWIGSVLHGLFYSVFVWDMAVLFSGIQLVRVTVLLSFVAFAVLVFPVSSLLLWNRLPRTPAGTKIVVAVVVVVALASAYAVIAANTLAVYNTTHTSLSAEFLSAPIVLELAFVLLMVRLMLFRLLESPAVQHQRSAEAARHRDSRE